MANNPHARDNLIPVKPGEVRNPYGRPRSSYNLIKLMKDRLDELFPDGSGKTYGEKMIEILLNSSVEKKDMKAINSVIDRVYGKAIQTQVVVNEDTNKIKINFGGTINEQTNIITNQTPQLALEGDTTDSISSLPDTVVPPITDDGTTV